MYPYVHEAMTTGSSYFLSSKFHAAAMDGFPALESGRPLCV